MKPSIPKGTRDFSPAEMVKRNYIFDTIRSVYQRYGYLPIETPSMENTETLMGKYGEEGDRLIFKILNSGDYLKDIDNSKLNNQNSKALLSDISEKALRYDLTVPFARYVVMHRNEITFPFKRYQIQPVWRADRPQKGRYREFYQCDADVIGSNSLLNEVELIQIIDEVFSKLGVAVTIKINNRKILSGIAEVIGEKEKIIDITVAIDKLDKIGVDGVNKELQEKGISQTALIKLQPLISFKGNNSEKLDLLKNLLGNSEIGKKGIEEVESVFEKVKPFDYAQGDNKSSNLELDITLARGLNYYTGAIIEVKVNHPGSTFTGSICGGGRYDDLTGIFGLPDVSGVGISFGADRIYDVLEELKLFPDSASASTKVLVVNFGEAEENYALQIARQLRKAGINTELYPDAAKLKKQFAYADAKKIPFVITAGNDERIKGIVALKNMSNGEQFALSLAEAIEKLG
ncbi:MAG: Histidine--tRNA ligase [Bacteroidia bacterium]|nr:Histidine--tRNA ligase [Bacteroidia bacterium]